MVTRNRQTNGGAKTFKASAKLVLDTSPQLGGDLDLNATLRELHNAGVTVLKLNQAGGSTTLVNYLVIDNASSGDDPALRVAGNTINTNLHLKPAGTGNVLVDGAVAIEDGIAAPSTIAGRAFLYVDTADGDLKIKFGDGTVKTIVTDT